MDKVIGVEWSFPTLITNSDGNLELGKEIVGLSVNWDMNNYFSQANRDKLSLNDFVYNFGFTSYLTTRLEAKILYEGNLNKNVSASFLSTPLGEEAASFKMDIGIESCSGNGPILKSISFPPTFTYCSNCDPNTEIWVDNGDLSYCVSCNRSEGGTLNDNNTCIYP